jgi:hypothetical protein
VLDWVVIGGQRCGTTSLYDLLRRHSELQLPNDKESPLLHRNGVTRAEYDDFMGQTFGSDKDRRLRGTITPQYTAGTNAARQLAMFAPSARLVLLTREPCSRSYSHYWLLRSRGREPRNFDEAICTQLSAEGRRRGVSSLDSRDCYVSWSEFGRIANMYLDYFPRESLLILDSAELFANPASVVPRILSHIGTSASNELGTASLRRSNAASTRARGTRLERALRESGLATRAWRLLPEKSRREVAFRVDRWQRVARTEPPTVLSGSSDDTLRALKEHFTADQSQLAELSDTTGSR